MKYLGEISLEVNAGYVAKVRTIYKKQIIIHLCETDDDTVQCQINFKKIYGKWKYSIKKDINHITSGGYLEAIIIPCYILSKLQPTIDDYFVDKILLGE